MQYKFVCLITTAVFGLTACLTPQDYYRPLTGEDAWGFGYNDYSQDDGVNLIDVRLPAMAGGEQAYEIWHRRAKDLCNGGDYEHNIFKAQRKTIWDYQEGGSATDYIMQGTYKCKT